LAIWGVVFFLIQIKKEQINMCGITGVVSKFSNLDNYDSIVQSMIDKIYYRGPDNENIININNRAILAHKRLKIIDLNNGNQPFISKCRRYILVYNGEIYNYEELKRELLDNNIVLQTRSDTELLIELLIFKKQKILEKINGMFSFFFYDTLKRDWIAARDHFGIKPFYYIKTFDKFIFSSEIKSLLQYPNFKKKIDNSSLSEYLTFQYTLDEKTLYKNVFKIEPGHVIIGHQEKILKKYKYWKQYDKFKIYKNKKNYNEELKFLLSDSIKKRKTADVNIASYLSGGTDSTLVSSLLSSQVSNKLNVFHGYFDEGDSYSELGYAKIASKFSNLKLNKVRITKRDFIDNLKKVIYYLDEPCAGPGVLPQYIVSKYVKQKNYKVIFGGQGGDEIFGGYARYQIAYLEQSLKGAIFGNNEKNQHIVSLNNITSYLGNLKNYTEMISNSWSKNLFGSMESKYFDLINRSNNFENFLSDDLNRFKNKQNIYHKFSKIFNKGSKSYIKKMTNYDLTYSLPSLLQVEDRVSMACSIESRCPFLDYRLVDFVNSIPPNYQYKDGINKSFLTNTFKKKLPKDIINREDKMGFPVPIGVWLKQKDFKSFIYDTIFTKQLRETNFFNFKELKKNFESPNQINLRMIWSILSISIWLDNFFND